MPRQRGRKGAAGAEWRPVTGALVQRARSGPDCSVGRVLFTFDPDHADDLVFLYRLRNRVARAARSPAGPDEKTVAAIVNEDYVEGQWRRWELPQRFTAGIRVYVEEVLLPDDRLPVGTEFNSREELLLPCEANAGPGGGIELLHYLRRDMERCHHRFVQSLARRGVRVRAAIVQANNRLFQPGDDTLPCLVLLTFDESVEEPGKYLLRLADRAFALKHTQPDDPDERFVADLVTDERATPYRRVPLPRRFTGGPVVYAADLWVYRPYLPRGYLEGRLLNCTAEPGPEGALEMLPSGPPPDADDRPPPPPPPPPPPRPARKRRRRDDDLDVSDPDAGGRLVMLFVGLGLAVVGLLGILALVGWLLVR